MSAVPVPLLRYAHLLPGHVRQGALTLDKQLPLGDQAPSSLSAKTLPTVDEESSLGPWAQPKNELLLNLAVTGKG